MRMGTLYDKPSSKESDTDKKENLGKKEIRPVDRLHQTKFCTSIKNLDYVEPEASTSSLQGDSEASGRSTFLLLKSRLASGRSTFLLLKSRLTYLEDRLNKLEQDEKERGYSTFSRLKFRLKYHEAIEEEMEKEIEEWDKSTLPPLKSQLKYLEDRLNKLEEYRKQGLDDMLYKLEGKAKERDESTFPRLKSRLKYLEDRLNELEQDEKERNYSTFSRLKFRLKILKAEFKEAERKKEKYHEAIKEEMEKEIEEWDKSTLPPLKSQLKYLEDRLNKLEEYREEMLAHMVEYNQYRMKDLDDMLYKLEGEVKALEDHMLHNYDYEPRKEWEELMIKKVQSIDSTQGFAIPPPSLSAPMTIPDGSQAQAVEKSSGPRSMMTEQRSTAARKQGLIAVQNLPFGMIRNIVYHYLYQKNRVIAGKLLMYMSVFIRSSNDDYIDVWPAYRESAEWNPVFVILCQTNFQGEWDEYAGFQVFKRRYDFVSSEAAKVFNSPIVQNSRLELNGFLTKCISDTDLINTHSNITIVNACPVRSRNGGRDLTKETCIVIHCRGKGFIPFTEQPFPKMISTLPVDVREGYFVLGMQTPDPERNVAPSGNSPEINNGTSSNNAATNDFQPFDTSVQTAQNADLNGHSAASAVNSSFSSSNNLLSNGSQANGDVDMTVDPCRLHEMNVDDLCQELKGLSLAYKELLQGKGQDEFNETLLMGTSISRTGCISSGTLGGFVSLPNGNIGFLTCAHVIGIEDTGTYVFGETNRVDVSQPSAGRICAEYKDRQTECGYVERAVFEPGAHDSTGVDAALVTITDRHPKNGEFIRLPPEQLAVAGFGRTNPLKYSKGKIMTFEDVIANRRNDLIKVGSKTGVTRGSLYLTDTFVRLSNPGMVPKSGEALAFFNQMEVFNPGFFLPGDSGALVFMPLKDDELHCMGLAIGHTSYSSCLVTPIENVFKKLRLDSQSFIDFSCRRH